MIGAIVCIIVLIIARKRLSGVLVIAATYVILIGATNLLSDLPDFATLVQPFGMTPDNAPYMGVEGMRMVAGGLTIIAIIAAIALRRLRQWAIPIGLLLTLSVSLQLLTWIDLLYGKTGDVTGSLAIAASAIVIAALLWEITVSGEAITNVHGRWLPRDARVYLYPGYISLVAVTVLFYSSLHEVGTLRLVESQFDSEEWVREGILFLGIPLVITLFMTGVMRWRASLTKPSPPSALTATALTEASGR